MNILTKKELLKEFSLDEKLLKAYLKADMPYLKVGRKKRFVKEEVNTFIENFIPEQEKLEKEFIDNLGRDISEYITMKEAAKLLKVKKSHLVKICKKDISLERVGKKHFVHKNTLLNYLQKDAIHLEISFHEEKEDGFYFLVKKNEREKLLKNIQKNIIAAFITTANSSFHVNKNVASIKIGDIPNFEKHANDLFELDDYQVRTIQKAIVNLSEKTHFTFSNPLLSLVNKNPVKRKKVKENSPILVVDGSFSPLSLKSGVGVVEITKDEVLEHSFETDAKTSLQAEHLAMYKALKIIKDKAYASAIVATDQVGFVTDVKRKRKENVWEKKNKENKELKEFYTLLEEMENVIEFAYYKNLKNDKVIPGYKKAHHLSRCYIESLPEEEEEEEEKNVTKTKKNTLEVKYLKSDKLFCHFEVIYNGKRKTTKRSSDNPVLGVLDLVGCYQKNQKEPLSIIVEKIPDFHDYMRLIFNSIKTKQATRAFKLFKRLEKDANFTMKDEYKTFLQNQENLKNIA